MVKDYILLIILLSINYVHNADGSSNCEDVSASTVDECNSKISDALKQSGYHCCFVKGRKNHVENSICKYLTEEEYDDIKNYKGFLEDSGYQDVSVDCKSYYLQIGILSLLLFLL
jgi:hypothetical protein